MGKMVVYKSLDEYCVTSYSNYNSYVQNARQIQRLRGFNSAVEVIEYFCRYTSAKYGDFIIIDN